MLLHYSFSGLKTKRVVFENVFAARDAACLEQMKELSEKRRLIEESVNETSRTTEATAREMAGGITSRIQQEIQKLDQYLPLLQNFIFQVHSASASPSTSRWISELKIRWTSILSSSPVFKLNGPKYFQINSLNYELVMSLFLYALILREQAFEVPVDLPISASLLSKSAGIFNFLNTELLPSLQYINAPEKPPEVTINVSSAMSLFCLAESQAVSIKMAEKKKMSASLLAKLHYGVAQYLDEVSALLSPGSNVSGKFLEFIHSCKNLHELRSHRHLAESYKQSGQVGVAIGLLKRGLSYDNNMPWNQSWREAFRNEVNEISELLRKCVREHEINWREKIPVDYELPVLEGTKIAVATPYELQIWERHLSFRG